VEIPTIPERDFDDQSDLLFGVRRSIRYHNHRRRFFDAIDKTAKILTVIAGSATFAAALSTHHRWTLAFAAAVAVLSTIDLIIASAERVRLYSDLAKRFATLETRVVRTKQPTRDELNEFIAERLMIESDEPPILRVLDSQCHNELCRAMGEDDCEFVKIGLVQGLFSQIIDLWPSKIKRIGPTKAQESKSMCATEQARQ
jgi:hypothetical protein